MALKQKTLHSTNKTSNSHPDFWDKAYIEGNTGWDIGSKTPIFDNWINSIDKSKNICVLGAGNGWDAINFAQKGHKVTAVDFAPSAINSMINRAKKNSVKMNIVQLNIFDLPKYYRFFFDVVVEYTCFCAIDPIDRQKYIETVSGILKKSGLFVGILFPLDGKDIDSGPPFNVDLNETLNMFDKFLYRKECEKSPHSIKPRKGREIFFIYEK